MYANTGASDGLNPFEIRGGLKPYASEIRCRTTACRGLYGRSQVVGEMSLQASFQAFGGGYFRLVLAPSRAGRRVFVGGMRVFAPGLIAGCPSGMYARRHFDPMNSLLFLM